MRASFLIVVVSSLFSVASPAAPSAPCRHTDIIQTMDLASLEMLTDLDEALKRHLPNTGSRAKKEAFLDAVLIPTMHALEEVRLQRENLLSLENDLRNGKSLSPDDLKWLAELKKTYQTEDLEELKKRVNVIPLDMLLAQAAEESGWATSLAARKCNNFFGIKPYSKASTCKTPSGDIRVFQSQRESVAIYLLSLNRHEAYKAMRDTRAELLAKGKIPTAEDLMPKLERYSERGDAYIRSVLGHVRSNDFTAAFKAVLARAHERGDGFFQ